MSEHINEVSRRAFLGGSVALGAAALLAPSTAFGETAAEKQAEADAVRNQLIGLQADLEAADVDLGKASDERDAAQAAMEAEQTKINDASQKISDIQEKLGSRARNMYRTGSSTFLDLVVGAATFEEFTQNWDLLNQINDNDGKMVDETKTLREEMQVSKDEFARQEKIAAEKVAEMQKITDDVAAKVSNAAVMLNQLDAEARALLEQEQAAAAAAAAAAAEAARRQEQQQQQQQQGSGSTGGGGNAGGGGGNSGGGTTSGGIGGPVGTYDSVVGYAMSRIGCPYVWAAAGPNEFDCSGLVRWAYLQIGVSLPHYTESLYACARNIVPVSQARPGDVLYRYGHVGIAVGYGGMPYVHAPTFGALVRDTDSLSWSNFTAALQF